MRCSYCEENKMILRAGLFIFIWAINNPNFRNFPLFQRKIGIKCPILEQKPNQIMAYAVFLEIILQTRMLKSTCFPFTVEQSSNNSSNFLNGGRGRIVLWIPSSSVKIRTMNAAKNNTAQKCILNIFQFVSAIFRIYHTLNISTYSSVHCKDSNNCIKSLDIFVFRRI